MHNEPIHVLLADDDEDDRNIFVTAFSELKIKTIIHVVKDGIELMEHLAKDGIKLPHVIFLDLNMSRKTGMECLSEIKQLQYLKDISIAIYSTSASEQDIEDTFVKGRWVCFGVRINQPNELTRQPNQSLRLQWIRPVSICVNVDLFVIRRSDSRGHLIKLTTRTLKGAASIKHLASDRVVIIVRDTLPIMIVFG